MSWSSSWSRRQVCVGTERTRVAAFGIPFLPDRDSRKRRGGVCTVRTSAGLTGSAIALNVSAALLSEMGKNQRLGEYRTLAKCSCTWFSTLRGANRRGNRRIDRVTLRGRANMDRRWRLILSPGPSDYRTLRRTIVERPKEHLYQPQPQCHRDF